MIRFLLGLCSARFSVQHRHSCRCAPGTTSASAHRRECRCCTLKRAPRGQAALEFALLYSAVILPLTFMIVFVAEMIWTWHSVVDFTRAGAQFAATHCWQSDSSGSNVLNWMQTNTPPMIDRDQFQANAAGIQVQYFSQGADGTLTPLSSCSDGGSICEPDVVSVSVTSYQFTRFSSFFKLGAVRMPPFTTTIPMESGGYQDATGACVADATQ